MDLRLTDASPCLPAACNFYQKYAMPGPSRRGTYYLAQNVIQPFPPSANDWTSLYPNRRRYSYRLATDDGHLEPPDNENIREERTSSSNIPTHDVITENMLDSDDNTPDFVDASTSYHWPECGPWSTGPNDPQCSSSSKTQPISSVSGRETQDRVRDMESGRNYPEGQYISKERLVFKETSANPSARSTTLSHTGAQAPDRSLAGSHGPTGGIPFIHFGNGTSGTLRPPSARVVQRQSPEPRSSSTHQEALSRVSHQNVPRLPLSDSPPSLVPVPFSASPSPAAKIVPESRPGRPAPASLRYASPAGYDLPTAEYASSEEELRRVSDWMSYRSSRERRGGVGQTIWYKTSGPFSLSAPPPSLSGEVDHIYMHHDTTTSRVKMWVTNHERLWVTVRPGDKQPSDTSQRLSLTKSGEPSWVTKASWIVYRSRSKRARRLDQPPAPNTNSHLQPLTPLNYLCSSFFHTIFTILSSMASEDANIPPAPPNVNDAKSVASAPLSSSSQPPSKKRQFSDEPDVPVTGTHVGVSSTAVSIIQGSRPTRPLKSNKATSGPENPVGIQSPVGYTNETSVPGVSEEAISANDPCVAPNKKRRLRGPSIATFLQGLLAILGPDGVLGNSTLDSVMNNPILVPQIRKLLAENGLVVGEDGEDMSVDMEGQDVCHAQSDRVGVQDGEPDDDDDEEMIEQELLAAPDATRAEREHKSVESDGPGSYYSELLTLSHLPTIGATQNHDMPAEHGDLPAPSTEQVPNMPRRTHTLSPRLGDLRATPSGVVVKPAQGLCHTDLERTIVETADLPPTVTGTWPQSPRKSAGDDAPSSPMRDLDVRYTPFDESTESGEEHDAFRHSETMDIEFAGSELYASSAGDMPSDGESLTNPVHDLHPEELATPGRAVNATLPVRASESAASVTTSVDVRMSPATASRLCPSPDPRFSESPLQPDFDHADTSCGSSFEVLNPSSSLRPGDIQGPTHDSAIGRVSPRTPKSELRRPILTPRALEKMSILAQVPPSAITMPTPPSGPFTFVAPATTTTSWDPSAIAPLPSKAVLRDLAVGADDLQRNKPQPSGGRTVDDLSSHFSALARQRGRNVDRNVASSGPSSAYANSHINAAAVSSFGVHAGTNSTDGERTSSSSRGKQGGTPMEEEGARARSGRFISHLGECVNVYGGTGGTGSSNFGHSGISMGTSASGGAGGSAPSTTGHRLYQQNPHPVYYSVVDSAA
ncbi:hypothetical protein ONZ51_g12524 [Trametes cubensis]|uniref:Uncharacterized protein n=1 Tax=Trametes cubensis TaxID=1111947 RepID=A0AAD7TG13_9APHY|nr:hypothetical protein ONZ51_g12524 [Trametes cubensis]